MTDLIDIGYAPVAPVYDAASRAKSADKALARSRVMTAKKLIAAGHVTSWVSLAELTRIPLTGYHADEFTFETCTDFLNQYVELAGESTVPVIRPAEKVTYKREVEGIKFGGFTQKPQQEKAVSFIIDHFFVKNDLNGILLPLDPGVGKGVITAILARYVLEHVVKLPTINDVLIITPKPVKIPMIRKLLRVGIDESDIGLTVTVLSYNDLSSKTFKEFFTTYEETDISGNKILRYKFRGRPPTIVFIDESQKIKKEASRAHKICRAFIGIGTKIVLTSATPAVTVADCMYFALASGLKDREGQIIGRDSWPSLARHIAQGSPVDVNSAAMERFNKYFAPAICRPPNDPSKTKVTNVLTVEEMPNNPALRKIYFDAEKDWLEAKERAGEAITDEGVVMAMFQILRNAAEFLSVEIFVDRIKKSIEAGHAPVVGLCYQSSLRQLGKRLDELGIVPRDKLSVIWGGKRDIKLSEVYDDMEFVNVVSKGDEMTAKELSKVRLTREYMIQRCRMNLTTEENEERNAELRRLRLYKQNETERQQNMDDFQEGRTWACLFTLASGGTGIDLDHQDTRAKQRDVFITTCYYAEEFIQAMGRCKRGATLTDVRQEIIVLAGTIAATHVVPLLEKKISSIRTLAAGHMDYYRIMEQKATFADLTKPASALHIEADVTDIDDTVSMQDSMDDADDENNVEELTND